MTTHNFGQYIKKVFHPFLLREGVKLPMILFVDGHSSHVGVEVADLCQQLGVILVALYPNTTRITQPADVSIFKPLKDQWKNEVDDWRSEHPGENFTLRYFGRILEKAVTKGIKKDSIVNGFRVCGLFPFNADNVDYSKCIAKSTNCTPSSACPDISCESNYPAATVVTSEPLILIQPEPSCSKDPTIVGPRQICSQLTISSNDPPSSNTEIPFKVFSDFVPIHRDKIKEAIEVMGADTLAKIQQQSTHDFSHEERIIQYFYNEFIRPFTLFEDRPLVAELPMNEQNSIVGIDETGAVIGELLIDSEGNVTISASDGTTQEDIIHTLNESANIDCSFTPIAESVVKSDAIPISSSAVKPAGINSTVDQSAPSALADTTNSKLTTRKASISEFLVLPPAPRRSGKHRNYTKKYFPVLTAGGRIAEIRKNEKEKQENELRKKIRAVEQAEAKQRAEEAKKERAEKRNQKKLEKETMKKQKENRVLKRKQNTNDEKRGKIQHKKIKTEDLKCTQIR
ncbi:uncharacterized protein LOC110677708 [Aedes aegypti]|uniref:Uncharacterized protein n=1 Tax=Aedes aegypti TaxID=7159 RepID=A0A6I8U143_AEDAE|nr:uncharacterized protein LOC110677708 [Aedes aegypti]